MQYTVPRMHNRCYMVCDEWCMMDMYNLCAFIVYNIWYMVYGIRYVVYGIRCMVHGLAYGKPCVVYGMWYRVYGMWYMADCTWKIVLYTVGCIILYRNIVYGERYMVDGICLRYMVMVYGMRCMVYGTWYLACGKQHTCD